MTALEQKLEKLSPKLKKLRERELKRLERYEELVELKSDIDEINQYHYTESPYRNMNLFQNEYDEDIHEAKDGFQWIAEMVSKPGWFDLYINLLDMWEHEDEEHTYPCFRELKEIDTKLMELEPYLYMLPKELNSYHNHFTLLSDLESVTV